MVRLVLLRVLESYFRRRYFLLLPIVLMSIIAGIAFLTQQDVYITSSVLFVKKESFLSELTSIRDSGFSWVTPAQTSANEINQLLGTNAFIRAIIQKTDLEPQMEGGPDAVWGLMNEVRSAIWIQVMGDNIVMFLASHEDPEITKQLVDATIESYIQWQINADREESVVAQIFFTDLIDSYNADLEVARDQMKAYLANNPAPLRGARPELEELEIGQLQGAISMAESRLSTTVDKEEDARLAMTQAESDVRQTYLVIDAANLPTRPASSKTDAVMNMIIFIVVGIVMTLIGIIGGALFDRSFRFAIDVRMALDLPVLAEVPDLDAGEKRKRKKKGQAGEEAPIANGDNSA